MLRLPVSGLDIAIRQPTGADDVYLTEERSDTPALAIELATRLVRRADGGVVDWGQLSVSDLEWALLMLRRSIVGDRMATDAQCANEACGARVDVTFSIREYLGTRKGSRPASVKKREDGAWFSIETRAGKAAFRIPLCEDLLAVCDHAAPWRELARRCIRPEIGADAMSRASRRDARIEKALEALAPQFSSTLAGECPECGTAFECYFDVLAFVTRELRNYAAAVYQDIHLLAWHYKWPEAAILSLPRSRRTAYAAMLGSGGVTA